jgi:hypothetical protein
MNVVIQNDDASDIRQYIDEALKDLHQARDCAESNTDVAITLGWLQRAYETVDALEVRLAAERAAKLLAGGHIRPTQRRELVLLFRVLSKSSL